VTESNPLKIFLRDTVLWATQIVPLWKRQLEAGPATKLLHYRFERHEHFLPDLAGGKYLPQIYVKMYSERGGEVRFSDDVVFAPSKQGLFQLLIAVKNTAELPDMLDELQRITAPDSSILQLSEASVIVEDTTADLSTAANLFTTVRAATADEFATSKLCKGRPRPKAYDPARISKEFPGKKYIIARPDRFVFAACSTAEELDLALTRISTVLGTAEKARL
jgi:hypothetical protein